MKYRKERTVLDVQFIYDQYSNGKSIQAISRDLNCSETVIEHRLKKYFPDIKLRKKTEYFGANHGLYTGIGNLSGKYWSAIVSSAKKRNLEFNITIEYAYDIFVKQNEKCAISGLDIWFTDRYVHYNDQTASLDRINSSIGYVCDNIQWVHKDVNKMKNNFDNEYFIEMCKKIYLYNK